MVTHKRVAGILHLWGFEQAKITDIYYEQTGNRNESAFYIGEEHVLKFTANLGKLKSHIAISKALESVGLSAAVPVNTLDGREYVVDGELYYCMTKRLNGKQLNVAGMYEGDYISKARFVGEIIGQLSLALAKVEAVVNEPNLYENVVGYAIPKLKGKLEVSNEIYRGYEKSFGEIYQELPRQVIHRDPNPGNIILAGEHFGFIDFELSEKNIRIFDPCYAATAILSESFDTENKEMLQKWIQIYQNIIRGYDDVVKLTAKEKEAMPYVVLSNQLLALAWFAEQEKFKELYNTNRKMTEWIVGVWEELQIG